MFLLLPLVSHMELGPAGQFIKELLMKKEAQQAALHYPHGHWIKLLLKPVEENQEDNQEDNQENNQEQNDAAL